jgi:hypothetical protein
MYAWMSINTTSASRLVEKHGMPWRPLRTTLATLELTGLILNAPLGS